MKHTAKRLLMSCLSMLLVLSLVLSLSPAVLAAGPATSGVKDVNGDGKITYVSFGDSVTNGYGMDGYRYEDGTNVLGFRREVEDAYPAMIAKALGAELEQMAISGFRMDELHWMLDDDYVADSYHTDAFQNWNRKAVERLIKKDEAFKAKYESQYDGTTASADKIIMTEYRNAVKNADLITIDLGTNNFGTFVTNTIQEILGLKTLDYEVNFTQYMDEKTAASLEAMLGQMVAKLVGASSGKSYDLAMTLARCLMYGYLGYTEHYDGAIEAIYELNPKAQVVVIDCYTMITGVNLEGGALGENLDLDELYDMFIDLANFYARELSPYANKVTHATLSTAPALFIDYYKDYETNKANGTYAESQYLYPTAERLMNEFVMEAMKNPDTGKKYDVDDPNDHTAFQKNVLDNIELLDSYVNNIQETVKTEVIEGVIDPQIKDTLDPIVEQVDITITAIELIYTAVEGTATAEESLPTAISGVASAREAVDTAIDGVTLSETILDMLIENLIEGDFGILFSGSNTSDTFKSKIIDEIENYVTDDLMVQAGFEPTDENRKMLAEEAYNMACVYYDNGKDDNAYKLAVIYGVRVILEKTQGYSTEEAQATAELAYELNSINETQGYDAAVKKAMMTQVDESTADLAIAMNKAYEDALAAGKTEDEAKQAGVIAGIAGSLTDENMAALSEFNITDRNTAAELVYKVAKLYEATYAATEGTDAEKDQAAVVTCLVEVASQLGIEGIDEETATTGYQLYVGVYAPAIDAGDDKQTAKDKTVVAAIKTKYPEPEGFAEALYAVYKGNATAEQEQLAYYILMVNVAGLSEDVATALCKCYAGGLDGQYNNEYVQTAMIFLITQVLKVDQETAADLYDNYLVYKNLPTTLSKIAKCDTIYFDALLAATEDGLNMDAVAAEFMAGTLKLDKPAVSEEEDPEAWAEYKSDSAMATLYFRYMSQDGVFTHPSEDGQKTLYNAAQGVLNSLLVAEADRDIVITEDTKLLVLGDFIAANEDGYVEALGTNLGIEPTNLSVSDFRINDVRVLLDSSYQADAYAKSVTASVTTDYKAAVKDSDVILLHLGAMNMGLIAKQLEIYMKDGSTYSMQFSTVDNMKVQNLGATMDGFLDQFSGAFTTDEIGALMLSFETYGYGYTTFADCLDNTVETIQELNPDADIVLVGMYDLLGDAYISDGNGMHLEMGAFVGHAVNLMNQHMQTYASMTDNVTYVDVSDTESVMATKGAVNMMEGGVDGIAAAFTSALPTADGYDYMTAQISCALGGHTLDGEITWNWASDYSTATASFHCGGCGKDVTLNAAVTTVKDQSCTEAGTATHTASVTIGGTPYTDTKTEDLPAAGHTPETVPGKAATCTETGLTEGSKCSVCGEVLKEQEVIDKTAHTEETIPGKAATCTEEGLTDGIKCSVCDEVIKAQETIAKTAHTEEVIPGKDATCTEDGLTEGTKCSVCGEILTAQQVIEATGHTPEILEEKDPTCTETGLTEGSKCSVCGEILEAQDEIPALGHNWDDGVVTKEATETETGIITYTCEDCGETKTESIPELGHTHSYTAVVTAPTCTEKGYTTYTCSCGDSYVDEETDALGHQFDKGVCTVCGYSEVTISRVYGKDRYKTAYAVADELKEILDVETFDTIIVAYGVNFPDALAGSYLSTELEAPILLTDKEVDADVQAYIEENLTDGGKVYILGGDAAVSLEFQASLEKAGIEVERLSGKDRYATNLAILEEAGLNGKEILVCTGDNYADSLSASAVNLPILLVNTKTNELTDAQKAYLEALGDGYTFYIIGGTVAVSAELEAAITEYGTVERVYGKDREATSVKVAEKFFEAPDTAALAYSRNFPDGLCGGLLAYKLNAPMLLVDAGTETHAESYVTENGIKKGVVLGGSGVISDEVIRTVFDLDEDFEIQ